jgi:hypothetical protein
MNPELRFYEQTKVKWSLQTSESEYDSWVDSGSIPCAFLPVYGIKVVGTMRTVVDVNGNT